jgi:hypothetical protein
MAYRDDVFARLLTFGPVGVQLLWCHPDVAQAAAEAFDARDASEALSRPSDDRLSSVRLAVAVLQAGGDRELARSVLIDAFDAADPLVRAIAGRFAWVLADRAGLDAVTAAADRHPDLAFAVDALRAHLEEVEAGTLGDTPTTDPLTLGPRAREAVASGQLERARRAAEQILEDQPYDAVAIYALGAALAPEDPVAARFLLGAAAEKTDNDDVPELPDAPDRLAAIDGPEGPETVGRVLRFATAWRTYGCEDLLHGGALAIAGRSPSLEPLSAYVLSTWTDDVAALEAAAARWPAIPSIRSRLAQVTEDGEAIRTALVADLRRGLSPTPLEAQIEAAIAREPVTVARELAASAEAAYEAKDFARAVTLADASLADDPTAFTPNQVKALALTFSERLAEAVDAYTTGRAARRGSGGSRRPWRTCAARWRPTRSTPRTCSPTTGSRASAGRRRSRASPRRIPTPSRCPPTGPPSTRPRRWAGRSTPRTVASSTRRSRSRSRRRGRRAGRTRGQWRRRRRRGRPGRRRSPVTSTGRRSWRRRRVARPSGPRSPRGSGATCTRRRGSFASSGASSTSRGRRTSGARRSAGPRAIRGWWPAAS